MNSVVCIKQVPDTASTIKVVDGKIDESGLQWVINPYDEFAIEEALRIKERLGEGKVTLLSVGPPRAAEALKSGLALGADDAILLSDDAFQGADPYVTALILAKAVQKLEYDIIFCGKQAVDTDHAQVGIALAELVNLPHVSVVTKVDIAPDKKTAKAEREVEGGKEVVETSLPAVIAAQKGLNEPRYPSLKGIMAVKKKPILEWKAGDLGLAPEELKSKSKIVEILPPPERKAGRVFADDPIAAAREVVRLLREEAKAI